MKETCFENLNIRNLLYFYFWMNQLFFWKILVVSNIKRLCKLPEKQFLEHVAFKPMLFRLHKRPWNIFISEWTFYSGNSCIYCVYRAISVLRWCGCEIVTLQSNNSGWNSGHRLWFNHMKQLYVWTGAFGFWNVLDSRGI